MIDKLEEQRVNSLKNFDSKTYYRLCRYMDKIPENPTLFNLGKPKRKTSEKNFQKKMKIYMSNYGLNGGAISYE